MILPKICHCKYNKLKCLWLFGLLLFFNQEVKFLLFMTWKEESATRSNLTIFFNIRSFFIYFVFDSFFNYFFIIKELIKSFRQEVVPPNPQNPANAQGQDEQINIEWVNRKFDFNWHYIYFYLRTELSNEQAQNPVVIGKYL